MMDPYETELVAIPGRHECKRYRHEIRILHMKKSYLSPAPPRHHVRDELDLARKKRPPARTVASTRSLDEAHRNPGSLAKALELRPEIGWDDLPCSLLDGLQKKADHILRTACTLYSLLEVL